MKVPWVSQGSGSSSLHVQVQVSIKSLKLVLEIITNALLTLGMTLEVLGEILVVEWRRRQHDGSVKRR